MFISKVKSNMSHNQEERQTFCYKPNNILFKSFVLCLMSLGFLPVIIYIFLCMCVCLCKFNQIRLKSKMFYREILSVCQLIHSAMFPSNIENVI